ncbi:MarR family winged helix-turn-helix transcriptional regulator [Alicyclobacillus dauci]|uniref:MarR family transcriptional regulator n=1 Tax=Alicyclobacillus dauci TaxID=1475485 RepID=A0ABY6Z0Y1_9BACL|nr:MarR family transcriptional regulator [Alicyclobacillus dauci]WAH36533.1 MarR family transcriptional regulator [Alicyclobacillus dauci]
MQPEVTDYAGCVIAVDDILEQIEQEVAIFARRMEFARVTSDSNEDLDRSGYLLLTSLQRRGKMTIGTLAEVFQLDISTVSRQVTPLIKHGYVLRETSDEDKRVSVLSITDEGEQKLSRVRASRRELYGRLLNDWSGEERAQFLQLLRRLNERIRSRQRDRKEKR